MWKRIAKALSPRSGAPFEGYYQRLLETDSQAAPRADEARRDFREALRTSLAGFL